MVTKSKIVPLEDDTKYVKLLVYGNSGVGKTVLAGSDEKVLFIAPEDDGTISAARFSGVRGTDKWPVNTWHDIVEAYNYLYEQTEEGYEGDEDEPPGIPYNWIIIDSLSEMQEKAMLAILKDAKDENPERDIDIPEIQNWQKYYNMFTRMVRAFNGLPVNVLYTALSRQETDENAEDFLTPDIQGKGYQLSQKVASLMTSYGYMKVVTKVVEDEESGKKKREKHRRVVWADSGVARGKDRTGVLAPYTEDLTLKQIREKIEAYGQIEDDDEGDDD